MHRPHANKHTLESADSGEREMPPIQIPDTPYYVFLEERIIYQESNKAQFVILFAR